MVRSQHILQRDRQPAPAAARVHGRRRPPPAAPDRGRAPSNVGSGGRDLPLHVQRRDGSRAGAQGPGASGRSEHRRGLLRPPHLRLDLAGDAGPQVPARGRGARCCASPRPESAIPSKARRRRSSWASFERSPPTAAKPSPRARPATPAAATLCQLPGPCRQTVARPPRATSSSATIRPGSPVTRRIRPICRPPGSAATLL